MGRYGPGKHYRKGMSLVEIMRMFPDDAAAEKWLRKSGGQKDCGSDNIQCGTKHKTMPYRCRGCRKWFSVKTHGHAVIWVCRFGPSLPTC